MIPLSRQDQNSVSSPIIGLLRVASGAALACHRTWHSGAWIPSFNPYLKLVITIVVKSVLIQTNNLQRMSLYKN